jgi:hypothetical protein
MGMIHKLGRVSEDKPTKYRVLLLELGTTAGSKMLIEVERWGGLRAPAQ